MQIDLRLLTSEANSTQPTRLTHCAEQLQVFFLHIWARQPIASLAGKTPEKCIETAHQICRIFCDLLLNEHIVFDQRLLMGLCQVKPGWSHIFDLSLRHAPTLIHDAIDDLPLTRTERQIRHIIALTHCSGGALPTSQLTAICQDEDPFQHYACWISSSYHSFFFTADEADCYRKILQSQIDTKAVYPFIQQNITPVLSPWMSVSYFPDRDARLNFKATLNRLIQQWWQDQGIAISHPTHRNTQGPLKLVIIAENFAQHHAMYRCYCHVIQAMVKHFDTHCITNRFDQVDPEIEAIFHGKIHYFDPDISQTAQIIMDLKPDILFYPSIGMRNETILLANQRFAPVQVMSLGHPDSTQSSMIDYLLSTSHVFPPDTKTLEKAYPERVVRITHQTDEVMQFTPLKRDPQIQPQIRPNPPCVQIAIVGMLMKINWQLIDICERIEQSTHQAIHFHFFPNVKDYEFLATQHVLSQRLTALTVHPTMPLDDYLKQLAQCDFGLGTFPFGGTNSLIDAFEMGTPVVTLLGDEPLSYSDHHIHHLVGTVEDLCVTTQADYLALAIKLIEDSDRRCQIAKRAVQNCHRIYAPCQQPAAFSQALDYLYHAHPQLQASAQNAITYQVGAPHEG